MEISGTNVDGVDCHGAYVQATEWRLGKRCKVLSYVFAAYGVVEGCCGEWFGKVDTFSQAIELLIPELVVWGYTRCSCERSSSCRTDASVD